MCLLISRETGTYTNADSNSPTAASIGVRPASIFANEGQRVASYNLDSQALPSGTTPVTWDSETIKERLAVERITSEHVRAVRIGITVADRCPPFGVVAFGVVDKP